MSQHPWGEEISRFQTFLQAAGRSKSTVYIRTRHITSLAIFLDPHPVPHTTENQLADYLSSPGPTVP